MVSVRRGPVPQARSAGIARTPQEKRPFHSKAAVVTDSYLRKDGLT